VSDERVEKLAQKYHLELDELLHFRTGTSVAILLCAALQEARRDIAMHFRRESLRAYATSWELSNGGKDEFRRGEARMANDLAAVAQRVLDGLAGGEQDSTEEPSREADTK
jgi:hypothetical protein